MDNISIPVLLVIVYGIHTYINKKNESKPNNDIF